ncbi:VOC family protein [Parafilimonas sp.]|uniref:VOC family protein n=1 Tax=Parafilimonas sp. TaxID=1969739 RepID=UPI0039E71A48
MIQVEDTLNYYRHFFQVAYVTTDITQSIKLFGELYGISKFLVFDQPSVMDIADTGRYIKCKIKLAFATVGMHQLELIEPINDPMGRYTESLPASGFGQRFHHLGCRFTTCEEWDTFRSSLDTGKHPIAFENTGGESRYLYLDERPHLGHYLEYMWAEQNAAMFDAIPKN